MTLSPDDMGILKYIGSVMAVILSGFGGAHIHKRKNSGWNENKDNDRRAVANHSHNSNGKKKYVPQPECDLRHEAVKIKLDNIIDGNTEIKRDIREINASLKG